MYNKEKIVIRGGLGVLLIGITGILIVYLFQNGYVRFNYPSYSQYPVRGIDVSNHQQDIDWQKLDKKSVQFVFMKATEGGDFKDKRFALNWKNAKKNGLVVGAYHFFTFCRSGEDQARNFIESVPDEPGTLPPAIDLEYGGNCKLVKTRDELMTDIYTYISLVENHYKKKAVIYVTRDFYEDYLIGHFPENPLWLRNIYGKPSRNKTPWTFWQFANKGRLDGIDTFVDLNLFNGTQDDFKEILAARIE